MLILSRFLQQSIIINNEIEIKILKIDGTRVILGCLAPKHISIHRLEIQQRIQETGIDNTIANDNSRIYSPQILIKRKKRVLDDYVTL